MFENKNKKKKRRRIHGDFNNTKNNGNQSKKNRVDKRDSKLYIIQFNRFWEDATLSPLDGPSKLTKLLMDRLLLLFCG